VCSSDVSAGRRELDSRLTSAQAAMTLHEETMKRSERERCQLVDRLDSAERCLAAADSDKRILEVLRSSLKCADNFVI